MSFGLHFFHRLRIVDYDDEPIAVPSDVKNYVANHVISVLERAANFVKIVPADLLDDTHPRSDFVRRIGIEFHRLAQMLSRNDNHLSKILHNM